MGDARGDFVEEGMLGFFEDWFGEEFKVLFLLVWVLFFHILGVNTLVIWRTLDSRGKSFTPESRMVIELSSN